MGERFVTPAQVAQATDGEISTETVRRLCRAGRFPGAQLFGRSWMIPQAAAEEFLRTYERYRPPPPAGEGGSGTNPPGT